MGTGYGIVMASRRNILLKTGYLSLFLRKNSVHFDALGYPGWNLLELLKTA